MLLCECVFVFLLKDNELPPCISVSEIAVCVEI